MQDVVMQDVVMQGVVMQDVVMQNGVMQNGVMQNADADEKSMHEALDKMIQKHKSNPYVFGRLIIYINNLLPIALDNSTELHKQREERKQQLNTNRDEFANRFLEKNNYFYSQPTELFLHYDGLHFCLYNEDDIQHQILTAIYYEKCLREWKFKVNKNIIKRIKERSPLTALPEAMTIQFVINTLCPAIFPTPNHVKYFLTIIGECIAGKSNNIYIFPPAIKEIIREIGNQCYTLFGLPNIFSQVKYKYHEHKYSDCRLLFIENKSIYGRKKIALPSDLVKYMLDFLCVAAHYMVVYGSADGFLEQCNEPKLVEHALFLNKNTPENMISTFVNKSLTPAPCTIDIKNMIFLWKKYLADLALPNVIFYDSLKTILKEQIKYDEEKECFLDITSIHLPVVVLFMRFWEENIIIGGVEPDANIPNNSYEIDEMCVLFKQWAGGNSCAKNTNENFILDLIQHFYPEVVIKNQTTLMDIKCKLWDKHNEVVQIYNLFKQKFNQDVLWPDVYSFYCLQPKNKTGLLVNKTYFEKICINLMLQQIGF